MSKTNRLNAINITKVMRTIWENPGISRIEIAHKLNLDKSTITKIVPELMEHHLVMVTEEGVSGPTGGRKPLKMEINKAFGIIAGIEIQTRSYNVILMNINGDVLFSQTKELDIGERSLPDVAWDIIQEITPNVDLLKIPLVGVGFGLSGIINPYKGILYQSFPLGIYEKTDFYFNMKKKTTIPIVIENDANCCAWGQLVHLKNQRSRNFLCVLSEFRKTYASKSEHQGIAIGLGLVIKGSVLHGDSFSAGEFRSILWKENNITQFSIPDDEASKISTDPEIAEKVFKELAIHIAALVNILNLTEVVIFGALEHYNEQLTPIIEDEINRNWAYINKVECPIRYPESGENAVAYGAAANLLEMIYTLPDISSQDEIERHKGIDLIHKITNLKQ